MNRRQLLLGSLAAAIVPPAVEPLFTEVGTAVRQIGGGLGCIERGVVVNIPNRVFYGPSMQQLIGAARAERLLALVGAQ